MQKKHTIRPTLIIFFSLNKERDRKDEGDVRISKYFNKESSRNFKKGYRNMKKAVWMVVIQNDINLSWKYVSKK